MSPRPVIRRVAPPEFLARPGGRRRVAPPVRASGGAQRPWAADSTLIDTPGPMVELTAIFFR